MKLKKTRSAIKKELTREERIVSALALAFLKNLGKSEIEKILESAISEDEELETILEFDDEVKRAILERYLE